MYAINTCAVSTPYGATLSPLLSHARCSLSGGGGRTDGREAKSQKSKEKRSPTASPPHPTSLPPHTHPTDACKLLSFFLFSLFELSPSSLHSHCLHVSLAHHHHPPVWEGGSALSPQQRADDGS